MDDPAGADVEDDGSLFSRLYTYEEVMKLRPEDSVPKLRNYDHWPPGATPDSGKWVFWLPPGWGQGTKITSGGKPLKCYISPDGKMYYHKTDIEKSLGRKLATKDKEDDGGFLNTANIHKIVPPWPNDDWLPKDWRIAYRKLPGRLHRVFVPPGQDEGFCYHKSNVEKFIAGQGQLSSFGNSKPMAEISLNAAGGDVEGLNKRKQFPVLMNPNPATRVKLSHFGRSVPQQGWAACDSAASMKHAFHFFRPLMRNRGFPVDTELVGIYGQADPGLQYASRIKGVYFKMPFEIDGHFSYQKLVRAAESAEGFGCDGIFIVWDAAARRWGLSTAPDRRGARFGYCEDRQSIPRLAPVTGVAYPWHVAADDYGSTFVATPGLTLVASTGAKQP